MLNEKKTQAVKELLKEAIEGKYKNLSICHIIYELNCFITYKLKFETYFNYAHNNTNYFILGVEEFKECNTKQDFWSGEGGELRRKWCKQVIKDIDDGKVGVVDCDGLMLLERES